MNAPLPIVVIGVVVLVAIAAVVVCVVWAEVRAAKVRRRRTRIARIEAELDEKAQALRERMFEIADALHREGHEARKAMIRASFLASGRLPRDQ